MMSYDDGRKRKKVPFGWNFFSFPQFCLLSTMSSLITCLFVNRIFIKPFIIVRPGPSAAPFSTVKNRACHFAYYVQTSYYYYKQHDILVELTWSWYSTPMDKVLIKIAHKIPCWNGLDSTSFLTIARKGPSSLEFRWDIENISDPEESSGWWWLLWWWWPCGDLVRMELGEPGGEATLRTGALRDIGCAFRSELLSSFQSGSPMRLALPNATCGSAPIAPPSARIWGHVNPADGLLLPLPPPQLISCSTWRSSRWWSSARPPISLPTRPKSMIFPLSSSPSLLNFLRTFRFAFRIQWATNL